MKNVCIYDENQKYAHIIKSFLLASECRTSLCKDSTEVCQKLLTGVFDGVVCVDKFYPSFYDIIVSLYNGCIATLYIGSENVDMFNVNIVIKEPFTLAEFALHIKSFVNIMKKPSLTRYVSVEKDGIGINCILEAHANIGGILYPTNYSIFDTNAFNNFFKNLHGEFNIRYEEEGIAKTIKAKIVSLEYFPNKVVKEVLCYFIGNDNPERQISIGG